MDRVGQRAIERKVLMSSKLKGTSILINEGTEKAFPSFLFLSLLWMWFFLWVPILCTGN